MNHLHFVQSLETLEGGGLGRAALELHDAMMLRGFSSKLISTGRKSSVEESKIIFSRFGPSRFFFSPRMFSEAHNFVEAAEFVHGHGFYVSPNWVIGSWCQELHKTLIYHPHGMFEPWILARSHWKKQMAHWLFENANFRCAKLWRALTVKEADQIKSQGITAPVVVSPNGIQLETFSPLEELRSVLKGAKIRKNLLFMARLHPKKGLDMLIQAWSLLPRALKKDWRVVLAGPDELGHRAAVEAIVARLGLTQEVIFTGSLSGSAKLQALAEADAFVLPSRSEGFSVAILEAMASRLPILATDACNFPELAQSGGGWCVEATVEGISQGLRELLAASDSEREQRGERARALVERSFTWPTIATQIHEAAMELSR